MSTLLIVRPEIFSILIMVFLILYDRYCAKFRSDRGTFIKLALACLGHCIFALVTEVTVNMEGLPKIVNDICHKMFFLFTLVYSIFYLEYALSLVLPRAKLRINIVKGVYIISSISVIVMIFTPITYLKGAHTSYSSGFCPILCFALGFAFIIAANTVMVINRNHIRKSIVYVMLPLSCITFVFLLMQLFIPEFLYTAQALTLISIGLFFVNENPIEKIQNQAFIDTNVQIWNRNCYENDLAKFTANKINIANAKMTYVIGDVNGLKAVNDNLGHQEGDRLIARIARILQKDMHSAYKVYRMGGDEFVAIYLNESLEIIQSQTKTAEEECRRITVGDNIMAGISIGYAQKMSSETFAQTIKRADQMMYERKRQYYQQNGIDRRH